MLKEFNKIDRELNSSAESPSIEENQDDEVNDNEDDIKEENYYVEQVDEPFLITTKLNYKQTNFGATEMGITKSEDEIKHLETELKNKIGNNLFKVVLQILWDNVSQIFIKFIDSR